MRKVFADDTLDSQFREKGYVKVRLLDEREAEVYYHKAAALRSGVNAPFHTSIWSSDPAYRKQADDLVKQALLQKALPYFAGYRPLFGEILVKKPSLSVNFPVHQDWTFVDEPEFVSVFVWCPLQDVNLRNGCLQVLEGSHRNLDRVRGANVPVSYDGIRHKIPGKQLTSLPLKAGECVIFSQALLHASPPNHTFRKRIAIGLLLTPAEAPLFHYYYDRNLGKLFKFQVDVDFFMHYSDQIDFKKALETGTFLKPEQYPLLEEKEYAVEPLSLPGFIERVTSQLGD